MVCFMNNIIRIVNKLVRELYRLFHPILWGKKIQINGIPQIYGANISLGKYVSINQDVVIQTTGGVKIGDYVTLSRGATILTAGLDVSNYKDNSVQQYRRHISKEVMIGNGTWIGANVTICPGAMIAESSIVAAGSVVVGELMEQGCLYAGVPARKIKEL